MLKNSGNQNSIGDILPTGSAILAKKNLPIVQTLEELLVDFTVLVPTFPWVQDSPQHSNKTISRATLMLILQTSPCLPAIALGTKLHNPEGLTLTLRNQQREECPSSLCDQLLNALWRNYRPMHGCCRHSVPNREDLQRPQT